MKRFAALLVVMLTLFMFACTGEIQITLLSQDAVIVHQSFKHNEFVFEFSADKDYADGLVVEYKYLVVYTHSSGYSQKIEYLTFFELEDTYILYPYENSTKLYKGDKIEFTLTYAQEIADEVEFIHIIIRISDALRESRYYEQTIKF